MEIRIRESGAVITDREFREVHENTTFPEVLDAATLDDFGADAVLEAPQPALVAHQSAVRDGVRQDALGNWVQAWAVRDWTAEEIAAANAAEVPDQVPMASARKALRARGIMDSAVRSAIANSPMTDAQKEDAAIDWEFQPFVHRGSPLVSMLGAALQLTEQQIDDLFIEAKG